MLKIPPLIMIFHNIFFATFKSHLDIQHPTLIFIFLKQIKNIYTVFFLVRSISLSLHYMLTAQIFESAQKINFPSTHARIES